MAYLQKEKQYKMTTQNFAVELSKWIKINGLTRNELINKLHHFNYNEFKGLDNITLSRWVNGKTTPPLYKQLYIAKCLNINIINYYLKIDRNSLKVTEKLKKAEYSLINLLDFSVTCLSYNKLPKEASCEINSQTFDEHIADFYDFHNNIDALHLFFEELYNLGGKVKYTSIKLKNEKGQVLGHYSGIEDITPLQNITFFNKLTEKELKNSSIVNVGFFKNSKNYFELLNYLICYYLISIYPKKDFLYLFVAGSHISSITKMILGIKEEKYFPPNNKKSMLGVYLFKIDILKTICNPLLLPLVQDKLLCVKNCDYRMCNLCNLRDFYTNKNHD